MKFREITDSDCYLESDDILTVHLDHVVVNEHSVPGGGRPLDQRRDLVVLEDKAHVTKAVLLQSQRSLERSTKSWIRYLVPQKKLHLYYTMQRYVCTGEKNK